jgi:hypothetical protein
LKVHNEPPEFRKKRLPLSCEYGDSVGVLDVSFEKRSVILGHFIGPLSDSSLKKYRKVK